MAKIAHKGSTGRFTIVAAKNGMPATIRDKRSGQVLPLEGYGALKGEYEVIKGFDLSKPIAAQAAKKAGKATAKAV